MRKRLLAIIDDWEALEVYEGRLAPRFELLTSPFGKEGVALAIAERPDRILLDLTFEDMHAAEAVERLREDPATQAIPLTVVLNRGELLELRGEIFPRPGDQLIQRPFDLEELISLLAGA
jgi:CheY-like chemotaxis protein